MWDVLQRRLQVGGWTVHVVALAFIAFTALDCFTTTVGVTHGAREQNPITATVLARDGVSAFLVTRTALAALVLAGLQVLPRRAAAWAALGCTLLTAAAVVSNVETLLH